MCSQASRKPLLRSIFEIFAFSVSVGFGVGSTNTRHLPHVLWPPHSEGMCKPSLRAASKMVIVSSVLILSPEGSKITIFLSTTFSSRFFESLNSTPSVF